MNILCMTYTQPASFNNSATSGNTPPFSKIHCNTMKPAPKKSPTRKPIAAIIQSAIGTAGSDGISARDIVVKTALPHMAVTAWLISERRENGSVTLKKGKYILVSAKTVLPVQKIDPTSLILPVIGAAGASGISVHSIIEKTALDADVVCYWLFENTSATRNPVTEMKPNEKYVLTAQGKVNLRKLTGKGPVIEELEF